MAENAGHNMQAVAPISHDTAERQLRVMSYNIHHGTDATGQNQLGALATFIRGSGADIVALQEVDSVCTRSGQVDQTAALAAAAGMHAVFVRHFAFQGGAYGLALLSKHPIANVEAYRLPVQSDNPGQSVALLTADLVIAPGCTVRVANVHMDYRSATSRNRQREAIVEYLKDTARPLILCGDLNAPPEAPEIGLLSDALSLADTHSADAFTFPHDHPDRKIDYILISPHFETTEARVETVYYSDHLPLISELRYRP